MKRIKNNRKLSIRNTAWAGMLTLIVVVGSVMAYGAVAVLFLPMNRSNALSMVFMVVPMTVLMFVSLRFVLRKIQGRMDLLTDALRQVAGGNLSVRLDEANAGEYAAVYSDFNHMVEELQRTKDEMMQFTNDFAHEFKTPLTSVKGFADYLYETGGGIESKERMEYLKVIAEQSGRLSRMASNTLILSKAEACQIPVHQAWFNMGEQIRRCFIAQSREMEQKHLTPDLPEDFDFSFYGNEEQLEQIWINLIGNAIKFTPEGGVVGARCEKSGGRLVIEIFDNGIGMDQETMAHAFDKYYQQDSSGVSSGNGIGLAIVRRIAELYGGSVRAESKPGYGSVFTVELPVRAREM
ncbi:MAG: HAMP domain-containing sensor histidine kinase [Lachnospiraceae bacterium]|nr:HAMP domain-containing sensor histidine kinase [Lachnospiraceae bacterium]